MVGFVCIMCVSYCMCVFVCVCVCMCVCVRVCVSNVMVTYTDLKIITVYIFRFENGKNHL